MLMVPAYMRPDLIAHADWSVSGKKRMLALGVRQAGGRYRLEAPRRVGVPQDLLRELSSLAGRGGGVLVGFDCPIGVPIKYARNAGFTDFITALSALGGPRWPEFYQVAENREQIHLGRPFYPARPGGARLFHLLDGLGLAARDDLLRRCERAAEGRRAAAPLFWTMGANQVGKAAIHAWQHILAPGLEDSEIDMGIWPFHGDLRTLIDRQPVVIAETYPAEYYSSLGVRFRGPKVGTPSGKRVQSERQANGRALLAAAHGCGAVLEPDLGNALEAGFGTGAQAEDAFDAVVGLLALLWIVERKLAVSEPELPFLREIEGWIIGRKYSG